MDTRKFEYLETIRETIEMGDYEELDDYVEDIRDQVKGDPEFQELFWEIKSKRYGDVISLIDEFIYQNIRAEADQILNNEVFQAGDLNTSKTLKNSDSEKETPEEISFEEFDENKYLGTQSQDDDF
jgi:hypothetical protein